MALFANDIDLKTTINKKTPSLAYVNFVASAASTKLLGQSGHLALSAPSQIIGRFQFLKTIRHPHLCSYIDIHRGKNDRLFVVSEYFDYSLQKSKGSSITINGASDLDISYLQKMACQILSALNYLHELGIIHCCLCPNLILFDPEHNVKLFGYGLNYMTGNGVDIDFPIGYPHYLSPEYIMDPTRNRTMKLDIWSLGIILLEEYTHQSFWTTSDLGLIFDSLSTLASLITTKGNIWLHKDVESLDINEHVLYFLRNGTLHNNNNKQREAQINGDTAENEKSTNQSIDQNMEESFHQFILNCLQVNPIKRLDAHALLSSPFLSEFIKKPTASLSIKTNYWVPGPLLASDYIDDIDDNIEGATPSPHEKESPKKVLDRLPISQVYHLWKLAGGDVELDAAKKDVFSVTPVIERLPRVCDLKENIEIGTTTRDSSQLYSDTVYKLEFKELYLRLDEGQKNKESKQPDRFEWDTDFFMVVEDDDVNFLMDGDGDDEENKKKKEKIYSNVGDDDDKLETKLEDEFIYTDENNTQQQRHQQHQNENNSNITKNDHVLSPISMSRQTSNLSNSSTPPPTTPSRPNRRTLSFTSLTRSDSISSLPPSSPTGNGSMSIPVTSFTSGSLSSMNGNDLNHSINNNNGNNKLPLFLREQDSNYQFQRQLLFSKLLQQYPASRKELIHQAKIDIPPLFRGKVWAALLGVQGDIQHTYNNIDKFTDIGADRQIEMDVPRCHQYNQLLASSVGHEKLKRLLKAWVFANPNCVYWQGLDSLCAPFLTLLFNDEAMAFACLQLFIPKLLNNFFLSDNSRVLQEYLAVFRHLLSYHDPELSSHLDSIGINPDLYAISWFLTLFTHVFSLDKIYHLWDKFLVGPSSLPLFAGIAILRQIRDVLLSREFNDCIVLINDIPKVDIEKCVQHAMSMCKVTPLSVSTRIHDENDKFYAKCGTQQDNNSNNNNGAIAKKMNIYDEDKDQQQPWWERPISLETKKKELAPRINSDDLYRILPYCLILDIRSDQDFPQHHIPSSMNVQIKQLPSYANVLKKLNKKYYVVFADKEDEGAEFATQLVNRHFPRVALLQSGIESLKRIDKFNGLCNCRPQKQTTAGHKGKGSEPPFVIWRCKSQLPIEKK